MVLKLFDAVVLGVAHDVFKELDVKSFGKENSVLYDVKWTLLSEDVDGRL